MELLRYSSMDMTQALKMAVLDRYGHGPLGYGFYIVNKIDSW